MQVRAAAAAAAMVALLAVAAVATRGDGSGSTAPPGVGAASSAGHHAAVVAVVVLVPILAVLGGALFVYAHIFRMRERDPEAIKRMKRSRRRTAIAFALLLAYLAYSLHTGRRPFGFLHLQNPFSGTAGSNAAIPRLHRPGPTHPAITSTDWTAIVVIWILLLAAATVVALRLRASRGALAPVAVPVAPDEPARAGGRAAPARAQPAPGGDRGVCGDGAADGPRRAASRRS